MKDSSDRRVVEPAASESPSDMSRAGRIFWGLLAIAIGGSMSGVMAVAAFHEILADDFFGVGVSGMVVVFGAQLVKIGYDLAIGRRKMAVDPDPLDALWHSDRRVYPFLPHSHLEVRGR